MFSFGRSSDSSGAQRPGMTPLLAAGQMANNQDGVAMGRPVDESANADVVAPDGPAPTIQVTGKVIGSSSSSSTVTSGDKLVACPGCSVQNQVAWNVAMLRCGNCGLTLRAGTSAAMHLQCCACGVVNLVNPGNIKIRCGSCQTEQDVPGPEAELQRQLQAQEAADLERVLQLSMKET
eukprot:TRINITY_DN20680_c0_g1_i1.p1 TRINITY_DN20680_c0_g1~~TRINITY_DN20680_c0_g1_i1.p1  ORF type:complete len:178 (-),score=22.65 TRINITY_DN20680_c0_g1_i1:190-723(-)